MKKNSQNLHITEQMSNQKRWNKLNRTLCRFSWGPETAIWICIVTLVIWYHHRSLSLVRWEYGMESLGCKKIWVIYHYWTTVFMHPQGGSAGFNWSVGRLSGWRQQHVTVFSNPLKIISRWVLVTKALLISILLLICCCPVSQCFLTSHCVVHWPSCFGNRFDVFLFWSTKLVCQTLRMRWWRFVRICGCHFESFSIHSYESTIYWLRFLLESHSWSVALRTFYRQILSLLYSSVFFWNFRPRLAQELVVY